MLYPISNCYVGYLAMHYVYVSFKRNMHTWHETDSFLCDVKFQSLCAISCNFKSEIDKKYLRVNCIFHSWDLLVKINLKLFRPQKHEDRWIDAFENFDYYVYIIDNLFNLREMLIEARRKCFIWRLQILPWCEWVRVHMQHVFKVIYDYTT